MNKKHFIIYYKKGTGTYIITEPRPWSRENQNYFPDHNFSDSGNSPRTKEIEDFLIGNFNFLPYQYEEIVVLINHDPNLLI